MNLLREYIRETLLTEAAKRPADLPDGFFVKLYEIQRAPGRKAAVFQFVKQFGTAYVETSKYNDDAVYGYIEIYSIDESRDGPCSGAFNVGYVTAASGYGPMLYDLAMEWATSNGGGLIADREAVSRSARAVWDYYLDNRSDVVVTQLDDKNNTFTSEDGDNCDQYEADGPSFRGQRPPESINPDWPDSPLSKVYRKPDNSTTRELTALGKLV